MAKQSRSRRSGKQSKTTYPRTAKLNSLMREIIATQMFHIDDSELAETVTVTGVDVDNDLFQAKVHISSYDPDVDKEDIVERMGAYRKEMQAAIAKQTKLRKTPHVVFTFDAATEAGTRIDEILNELKTPNSGAEQESNSELEGSELEEGSGGSESEVAGG